MSGFDVVTDALVEFAGAVDRASAELGPLDPTAPPAEVAAAVPGTATAAAMSDLAIRLTVSCQALADAVAELGGAARGSASTYRDADNRSVEALTAAGGAR